MLQYAILLNGLRKSICYINKQAYCFASCNKAVFGGKGNSSGCRGKTGRDQCGTVFDKKETEIDQTQCVEEVLMRKLLAYLEKLNIAATFAQAGIDRIAKDYLS